MKQELFATRNFVYRQMLIWTVAFGVLMPRMASGINPQSPVAQNPEETSRGLPQYHVVKDSLEVVIPGKNGVPLPEKVKADHSRKNRSFAPGRIIPGESELPLSREQYDRGVSPVQSRKPRVVPAGKPQVVPLLKPTEKRNASSQNQTIKQNPLTGESLRPPKTYHIPDTGDASFLVQHGDTILPPRITPVKQPRPIKAAQPRFKDIATRNIQYLDVDQGLSSSYVLSVTQDQRGNIWMGTSNGVIKYDGVNIKHFSSQEGLSHNYVRNIHEDRQGNLWFSTWGGGVIRYDGSTFAIFTEQQGLGDNYVKSIFEDREGNLWFGTRVNGVSKYNGKSFTHYTTRQGLNGNYILSITQDKKGNLWFGTYKSGISKFDGRRFTQYTTREGLSHNMVLAIQEDDNGKLWIGTDNKLNSFNGSNFRHYGAAQGLVDNRIAFIEKDHKGNLWISMWGNGLMHYNGRGFLQYNENEGLSNSYIRTIFEDRTGNVWLGTEGGGVCKFQDIPFRHFTQKEGLLQNNIWSVHEDNAGNIWIGTWDKGVSRYNGRTFTHYTTSEGLSSNFVKTIYQDSRGNIWLGTRGGGVNKFDGEYFTHYTEKSGLSDNYVLSITEDAEGNMWFGTYGGGISKFDGTRFTYYTMKDGLCGNRVFSIVEDEEQHLWFGTYGGGVCQFDGEKFTHYTRELGLEDKRVPALYKASDGSLWAGTYGGGVSKYNGQEFIQFTTHEGLSHNTVYSVLEDKQGYMWFSTENGLSLLINKKEKQDTSAQSRFINFTRQDGLKGLSFYTNAAIIDSKNRIWWGSGKALTMLDRDEFSLPETAPRIHLRNIRIDQHHIDYRHFARQQKTDSGNLASVIDFAKQVKPAEIQKLGKISFTGVSDFSNSPKNLKLPYNLNHLGFQFAAIDWHAPHKIQYRYKLEGLDQSWSRITSETKADYRNIPHGSYTFKAQARGISGKWSRPLSYSFVITPPWWHTWWAWAAYIIIGLLIVLGYIRWRIAKLKKRQKELQHLVNERTNEIQMQNEEIQTQAENLKETNQELNRKNKSLHEMNREKNSLMQVVAHDLKTPLNNVYALINLVEEENEELTQQQQEYLKMIYGDIDKGNNLIQDLLDINAIEEFQTKINYTEIDPEHFAEQLVKVHENQAAEKQIQIHLHSELEHPRLSVDREYLQRILDNLLSNAIKFSPFNRNVYVTLSAQQDNIRISIKDEGPGFRKKDRAEVFKKFRKLSARPTNNEPSSGLGLSIVKTLLDRLHGQIELNTAEGAGSEFIIILPGLVQHTKNANQ